MLSVRRSALLQMKFAFNPHCGYSKLACGYQPLEMWILRLFHSCPCWGTCVTCFKQLYSRVPTPIRASMAALASRLWVRPFSMTSRIWHRWEIAFGVRVAWVSLATSVETVRFWQFCIALQWFQNLTVAGVCPIPDMFRVPGRPLTNGRGTSVFTLNCIVFCFINECLFTHSVNKRLTEVSLLLLLMAENDLIHVT